MLENSNRACPLNWLRKEEQVVKVLTEDIITNLGTDREARQIFLWGAPPPSNLCSLIPRTDGRNQHKAFTRISFKVPVFIIVN